MSLSSQISQQNEEAHLAAKFRRAAALCRDELNPDEIFGAHWEIEDHVHHLLEEVPDPVTNPNHALTLEKLGILYTRACKFKDSLGDNIKLRASLESVFSRIQHYLSSLAPEIDIEKETRLFTVYFSEVLKQEVDRFLMLAGLEPDLTKLETYEETPNFVGFPFKGDDLKKIMKTYNFLFHYFLMDFGVPQEHPFFKQVVDTLKQERDWHIAKVRLALIRKLQFSITKPYSMEEYQKRAESKADQDASLLPMLDFIRHPVSFDIGDGVINELKNHLETADKILSDKAKENPGMFHHLQLEMLPSIILQAEKLVFHVKPSVVIEMNSESQFRYDHEVPETLPLYVEGLKTLRGVEEGLEERLLTITNGNKELADQIETFATKSLFLASLTKNRDVRRTFLGFHGERRVDTLLDDASLFLTLDSESNSAHLTGYARILLVDTSNDSGEPSEAARFTLKVDVPLTEKGATEIRVGFQATSYSLCMTEHRQNSSWNLL